MLEILNVMLGNQRGGIIIIGFLLMAFVAIGGVAYYLGIKQNSKIGESLIQNPSSLASPITLPSPSVFWETESFKIETKELPLKSKQIIKVSLKKPSDWKLESVLVDPLNTNPNLILQNCTSYELSNSQALLVITPNCSNWAAEYSEVQNTKVIQTIENTGLDGHTAYKIRHFDSFTKSYLYADGESETRVMNAYLIAYDPKDASFIPFDISLHISDSNHAHFLDVADKIVSSITASTSI